MATLILWILILCVVVFRPGRKKKQKKEQRAQNAAYGSPRGNRQAADTRSQNSSYRQASSEPSHKKQIRGRSFWGNREEDGSAAITFKGLPEGTDELEYLIRRNREHERALESHLESREK